MDATDRWSELKPGMLAISRDTAVQIDGYVEGLEFGAAAAALEDYLDTGKRNEQVADGR